MKRKKANLGFSLLELLIYVSILSIVSLVMSGMFITINRGSGQVEVRTEVNSNLRFAVEKISQDLRAASSLTTPATAGSSSSNLVMVISGSSVEYCVVSGQLHRQAGSACNASSESISSDKVLVNAPVFSRLENNNSVLGKTVVTVGIDLTITSLQTAGDKRFSSNKKAAISLK